MNNKRWLPLSQTSSAQRWPIPLERYDRCATLSLEEQKLFAQLAQREKTSPVPLTMKALASVARLSHPLQELLALLRINKQLHTIIIKVLFLAMQQHGTSFWAWSSDEWKELIESAQLSLGTRYQPTLISIKLALLGLAYVLSEQRDFYVPLDQHTSRALLATRVFGEDLVHQAVDRVWTMLSGWGYSERTCEQVRVALCVILLINRSPYLEDISLELLAEVRQRADPKVAKAVKAVSRALNALGFLPSALPTKAATRSSCITERDISAIHPTWLMWCDRWKRTAMDLSERSRAKDYGTLLKCGRWLAVAHPEIHSPEQWTYEIALSWVAAVDVMQVGDFDGIRDRRCYGADLGKPLMPRSKYHLLAHLRRFFRDLQDIPSQLPRRFNPERAFRTPRQITRRIGPDPRDIKALTWARLVQAAVNLAEDDLPRWNNKLHYPLPLARAVAVVWCYAGLRVNEIARLRVGCVRYQEENVTVPETGELLPKQSVCFLSVPVTKTNTTQVKPVNPLIGKVIREWEALRPEQPPVIDEKTGEWAHILFSLRGQVVSHNYLNRVLIPVLCKKAGIPNGDERGRFTSHRARSTIATLLYNAPEGLTITELSAWLGHQYLSSTQQYAALKPNRLAVAYTKAEENSILVKTLVDVEGGAKNQPVVYTVLDDGGLCSNPEWATCPVRMACKKCQFHVPTDTTSLLLARNSVRKMLQLVDLRPDERAVLEEDESDLTTTLLRAQNQTPPKILSRKPRTDQTGGIPLTHFFTTEVHDGEGHS